jgi:hypothetical protein
MIYQNGKFEDCCFVKNDIITLHNNGQLKKLKKPMFLLLTFPLANQIKTHVTI